MSVVLGIDIGGTKIAAGLVGTDGQVIEYQRIDTNAQLGGKHVLNASVDLAQEMIKLSSEPVLGIGIGAGGQIDSDHGIVVSATDILPGWAGIKISDTFQTKFSLPVKVDNDVNALACGEAKFGTAKGHKLVVFIALGTGVGGAILLDGKIVHGAHWTAGEIGHMIIDHNANARIAKDGSKGALEAYCSGAGLLQTYFEISGQTYSNWSGSDIGNMAVHGDETALKAVHQTGQYLGIGVVNIANVLDPDMIVIGGGLSELGDFLLNPARQILKERALHGPSNCPVISASLGEYASVIGSASLVMRETE
jgi:glucokinase